MQSNWHVDVAFELCKMHRNIAKRVTMIDHQSTLKKYGWWELNQHFPTSYFSQNFYGKRFDNAKNTAEEIYLDNENERGPLQKGVTILYLLKNCNYAFCYGIKCNIPFMNILLFEWNSYKGVFFVIIIYKRWVLRMILEAMFPLSFWNNMVQF